MWWKLSDFRHVSQLDPMPHSCSTAAQDRFCYRDLRIMTDAFGTEAIASGYASSRPPVHPRVIEEAYKQLGWSTVAQRALDVGCGAGVSTRALEGVAKECIGIEPSEAMLKWSAVVAPGADFAAGNAEAIPLCDHSVDLLTAAGSLNYVNLDLFFVEAARVLRPVGALIIYDFTPGRTFRHTASLDEWFTSFMNRYPQPASEWRILSPEILAELDSGFQMQNYQYFEIEITLTPQLYIDYILTETNVDTAVRNGVHLEDIRSWCTQTLDPIWNGREQQVLFRGYFVCMVKPTGSSCR
jgi:ubiquinone/menaquinone biosynthesis C-methylase UbiE